MNRESTEVAQATVRKSLGRLQPGNLRALWVLVLAGLLVACGGQSGGIEVEPTTGALRVEIVGLPAGLDADVTVEGPGVPMTAVTGTQEFPDLEPGDYTVEVSDVRHDNDEYRPSVSYSRTTKVTAGRTVTERVEYGRTLSSLEINVTGLDGLAAAITVTGPEGYEETLSGSESLDRLVPGTYWISASDVIATDSFYEPTPRRTSVVLKPGFYDEVLDIEFVRVTGTIELVTDAGDDVATVGTLRYWLAEAALPDAEIARIDFSPASFAAPTVIQLTDELTIDHDIRIVGLTDDVGAPIVTLKAAPSSQVLTVGVNADASVRNLRVVGAVGGDGGAIYNAGALTLENMVISDNVANYGGGIYNDTGAELFLSHSKVVENAAGSGGGIANLGTMHVIGSDVSINRSTTGNGAGILNMNPVAELFVIQGSTLSDNVIIAADGFGGGIHNQSGKVEIHRSAISGNEATDGGGLSNSIGTLLVTNGSSVEGNGAANGGGIHNTGALTIGGKSVVAGNRATSRGGGVYNAEGADVEALIDTSTLQLNEANLGGGVWNGSKLMVDTSVVQENLAGESGGGIYNSATGNVEVIESHVRANEANGDENKAYGGGIRNLNVLSLTHSTIADNLAERGGGLAVTQSGYSRIINTTFANNSAARDGGGIVAANLGSIWLSDSTVRDNRSRDGAGIAHLAPVSSRITDSAVTGNIAESNGGGIFTNGELGVTNLTLVGNGARRGAGLFASGGSEAYVAFSTISGNELVEGTGSGIKDGGGIYYTGPLTLRGTIVAGNGKEDASVTGPDVFRSGAGSVTSHGYNVIGNDAGAGMPGNSGDLLNVDPLLGSLQMNGGGTQTMQLLPGSPALDLAPELECKYPSGALLRRDQRDAPRPGSSGRCDAGAFQTQ